ncbi:MAG: hypothetical protein VKO39_01190 [Cyanobacteriota bacterium]|nr:hypothetical protein [Cyanobacteriota bacterium]
MIDPWRPLRSRLRERWRQSLRVAGRLGMMERLGRLDRDQWQALAAYRGLVHQAFAARPLAPQVSSDLWDQAGFHSSADRRAFFSPAQRELEPSSHHYGHDVQLKRHAGLPLIGRPLPWLLEHGLKVSPTATFERPRPWSRGYLCMGPRRAGWLGERFGVPAVPIGPWIHYARPLLEPPEITRLREAMGPTLLVVLAHSWDQVERRMDLGHCIAAVAATASASGYRQVIWLRHWKDPQPQGLPPDWLVACNGHRSNPWFLDAMRTLLELSDGLVSNAFGTHLGYAVALGKRLHWIPVTVEQDLTALAGPKAAEERKEWSERERLGAQLLEVLETGDGDLRQLLDPYWGFASVRSPQELWAVLRGAGR